MRARSADKGISDIARSEAVWAEADENSAVAPALRVPVRPFFEQGRPERQPPILVTAIRRAAMPFLRCTGRFSRKP